MNDKNNLYVLGVVAVLAIVGMAVMVLSSINHYSVYATDTYGSAVAGTDTFGQAIAGTDLTPRIAYWSGKVNQHVNLATGKWMTDSDGKSGYTINTLTYCKKWYPKTTSVAAYKMETITTWRNTGNKGGPFTSTKQSYKCVQPSNTKPIPPTPTCTNECALSGAKQCSGTSGYLTCGNYDTDSCLEWSTTTACSSGQTCAGAGVCTIPTVNVTPSNYTVLSYSGVCGDNIVGLNENCERDNIRPDGFVTLTLTKSSTSTSSQQTITMGGKEYIIKLLGFSIGSKAATINVNGEAVTLAMSTQKTISGIAAYISSLTISGTGDAGNVTLVFKGEYVSECTNLNSTYVSGTLSCTSNCRYNTSACVQENKMTSSCTDSDGPYNYNTSGYVTGSVNNGDFTQTDYCVDLVTAADWKCNNNDTGASADWSNCPYGCVNGACIPQCTDSDGGMNFYLKGITIATNFATGASVSNTDSCFDFTNNVKSCSGTKCAVYEYYCQTINGRSSDGASISSCPNGCINGACNPKVIRTNTSLIE